MASAFARRFLNSEDQYENSSIRREHVRMLVADARHDNPRSEVEQKLVDVYCREADVVKFIAPEVERGITELPEIKAEQDARKLQAFDQLKDDNESLKREIEALKAKDSESLRQRLRKACRERKIRFEDDPTDLETLRALCSAFDTIDTIRRSEQILQRKTIGAAKKFVNEAFANVNLEPLPIIKNELNGSEVQAWFEGGIAEFKIRQQEMQANYQSATEMTQKILAELDAEAEDMDMDASEPISAYDFSERLKTDMEGCLAKAMRLRGTCESVGTTEGQWKKAAMRFKEAAEKYREHSEAEKSGLQAKIKEREEMIKWYAAVVTKLNGL
jgi:hypothetical protein